MPFPAHIFKAYDVRGFSPEELDGETAYLVGQALVKLTKAKTVVVGRDMRGTSPYLFDTLARGVMSQGADVIDIGLVTTPMLYFATAEYDLHDAGVMITASHNPKEYNGLKLCYGDAMPIGGGSGMEELRDIAAAGPYKETKSGTIVATDIKEDYLRAILSRVAAKKMKPLLAVVDTANGMAGAVVADMFERIPCEMHGMFLDLDGNFPNHEANPLNEDTLAALKARIGELRADVGFAFDGDGDRVGVVDDRGETVRGDILTALLAPLVLEKYPGAAVLYDVRSSRVVAEEVARAGGRPVMCRVGHGLIKPQMRDEDAAFAGELSCHFYFQDVYGAESSDLVMLLILQLLSETGKKLSELVAPLKCYADSGEINFTVADRGALFAKLESVYGHEASTIMKIDGLRMEFFNPNAPERDWWFSVRASNTEPLVRLNAEAANDGLLQAKVDELRALII